MAPSDLPAEEIRLSDAERELVLTQLRQANRDGRLSLLEFEDRAGEAYAAQFPSQLTHLTRDLPADNSPVTLPPVDPHWTPTMRARRWLVSVVGGSERRGDWDPGRRTRSITVMAGQVIDLTDVKVETVNITAFTLMGGTEIIVPEGAQVDTGGLMLFGAVTNKAVRSGESRMRVTVRAWGGMGGCEVRNLKKRELRKRAGYTP